MRKHHGSEPTTTYMTSGAHTQPQSPTRRTEDTQEAVPADPGEATYMTSRSNAPGSTLSYYSDDPGLDLHLQTLTREVALLRQKLEVPASGDPQAPPPSYDDQLEDGTRCGTSGFT